MYFLKDAAHFRSIAFAAETYQTKSERFGEYQIQSTPNNEQTLIFVLSVNPIMITGNDNNSRLISIQKTINQTV